MQVAMGENGQRTHCEDAFGPPNDYRPTCAKCTRAEKNQSDDFSVDSTDDEDQ